MKKPLYIPQLETFRHFADPAGWLAGVRERRAKRANRLIEARRTSGSHAEIIRQLTPRVERIPTIELLTRRIHRAFEWADWQLNNLTPICGQDDSEGEAADHARSEAFGLIALRRKLYGRHDFDDAVTCLHCGAFLSPRGCCEDDCDGSRADALGGVA